MVWGVSVCQMAAAVSCCSFHSLRQTVGHSQPLSYTGPSEDKQTEESINICLLNNEMCSYIFSYEIFVDSENLIDVCVL